tara:strand:- start:111 stop:953 length:843 start_codon:yes stop_codon:yes gene_type:complete
MIKLEFNNKKGTVLTEFHEVDLRTLGKGLEIFHKSPLSVQNFFLQGEDAEEKDIFNFAVKWISNFSTLTINELRLVNVNPLQGQPDTVSLSGLLDQTKSFILPPERVEDIEQFTHNGKTYSIVEPLKTIGGAKLYFGNASYEQFKLSSMLNDAMSKGVGELRIDSLIQLVALLYSDGDDSEEGLEDRIKEFYTLDSYTGFSAWFFFAMLSDKYKQYFQSCLNNQQAQILTLEEIWKKRFRNSFIGRLLRMKPQKLDYLILKDSARKNLFKKRKLLKSLNT